MLGARKERHATRLVPICLEAAVPADHFYRHLEAVLDMGFVRDWVADRYAERGRPSFAPAAAPRGEMTRVACTRRAIEEGAERARGEVGLDYDVRTREGWYRSGTHCLIACTLPAAARATTQARSDVCARAPLFGHGSIGASPHKRLTTCGRADRGNAGQAYAAQCRGAGQY